MVDDEGGAPMGDDRFDTLTERQKACLRLVHDLRNTAEIAREPGASKDAIDKAIKGAMAKLGANRRADAARMLIAHEVARGVQRLDPQRPDLPDPAAPVMKRPPLHPEAALDQPARLELREQQSAFELPATMRAERPEAIGGKGNGKQDLTLADPLGKALDIVVKLASASALVCVLAILISHFYRR
jgi:DNA-binding CsgD family transcriptional regulator